MKYNERIKFNENHIYQSYSHQYDNWVLHYELSEIFDYLNTFDFGNIILDCGCGTGLFSIYLAQKALSLTCLDLNKPQLQMLERKIFEKKISNILIEHNDALIFLNADNVFNIIFLGFSIDNILGIDVKSKIDNKLKYESFIMQINNCLINNGTCFIIDSLPAKDYKDNNYQSFIDVRNMQLNVLSKMNNFTYKEFDIEICFKSKEDALKSASMFYGKKRAELMFQTNIYKWSVFITSFKKQSN